MERDIVKAESRPGRAGLWLAISALSLSLCLVAALVGFERREPAQITWIRAMDVITRQEAYVRLEEWERWATDVETGYRVDRQGRRWCPPMMCWGCGARVPRAPVAPGGRNAIEVIRKYRCPLCGKPAYHTTDRCWNQR